MLLLYIILKIFKLKPTSQTFTNFRTKLAKIELFATFDKDMIST